MRTLLKPFAFSAALAVMASALPAAAASGDLQSIAVRDFDRDGKVDRLVVAFANPDRATWSVTDASGISVTYDGQPLQLEDAFMAAPSADPAVLEVVLDEADARLPVDTSAAKFELSYAGAGVNAGVRALAPIASGDATEAATERDEASPIMIGSVPAAGSVEVFRTSDLTLIFSEAVDVTSLVPSSSQNPGQWGFTASSDRKTVTVIHLTYRAKVEERFGIAGKGLDGNAIVAAGYPNPFTFRTTDDTTPDTRVEAVFALTAPAALATLATGEANVLAWYANQPNIVDVHLSYSTDAGATYTTIARVPASQRTYVWYPPSITSSIQLRLDGLDAGGTTVAVTTISPVNIAGTAPPFTIVSPPTVELPSPSSAVVVLRLDKPPAAASFSCGGPAYPVSVEGIRPVRLEVSMTGLSEGAFYACRFTLSDGSSATTVDVPTFKAEPDMTGPQIIGAAVVDLFNPDARSARLTWTTDEPSRAEVRYGLELDFGRQAELSAFTTAHEVTLLNLTPGVLHQARITSIDAKGNASVSKDWYFVFLRDGDLIKGSGSAVYRYEGGKRRTFPHLEVYRSWYGDDFSKVIRVPDTQLGTIALGPNMTMKEGVFMVKIQTDPKTYAVEPGGVLRWIQTEADARALYGDGWAARVRDVDVSLFTDYVIAPPLSSGEKPVGYVG